MGFIAMVIINSLGYLLLLSGATWIAPILGFTKLGIAAGSLAASAQSYYGGALATGSIISLLMKATMGPLTMRGRGPHPICQLLFDSSCETCRKKMKTKNLGS